MDYTRFFNPKWISRTDMQEGPIGVTSSVGVLDDSEIYTDVRPYKYEHVLDPIEMPTTITDDITLKIIKEYEAKERRKQMIYKDPVGKFIFGNDEYIVTEAQIEWKPGCEGRLTGKVREHKSYAPIGHRTGCTKIYLVVPSNVSVRSYIEQLKHYTKNTSILCNNLDWLYNEATNRQVMLLRSENEVDPIITTIPTDRIPQVKIIDWLLGRIDNISYRVYDPFYALTIKKIEVNNRKDTVAVFWTGNNFPEDSEFGTSDRVTVVKRQVGEPFNIFNAVAAAFCINKYKTRSHFRKVLRDKYGTDDIYNTVAMFELVEHFGSIDQVKKIVEDKTEYLYPIDKIIEVEHEFNKNLRNDVYADISKAVKECVDFMKEQFGDALKNIDLNKLK